MIPDLLYADFDREVEKYPRDQRQSAVMACLALIQKEYGYIHPDAEKELAQYLGMSHIAVREVTTFYNMYNQKPVGRFKINVCTNLPCRLRGGDEALMHLCEQLNISPGETTPDHMFTIQQSECLGACADAPVLLVNDQDMCSDMNQGRLDQLLDLLKHLEASE